MPGYGDFAEVYDLVMSDGQENADWVRQQITRYLPSATSLLELGCGTGSVLRHLDFIAELTGLDASVGMLDHARSKVPRATLIEGDIADFDLNRRFDVVICVFDTLNHLEHFNEWLSAFDAVAEHLVPGGLFLFDVNTLGRLNELVHNGATTTRFDGGVLTIEVAALGGGLTEWTLTTEFDDATTNVERVRELGVELELIRAGLSANFEVVSLDDGHGGLPTDYSPRAFFSCLLR